MLLFDDLQSFLFNIPPISLLPFNGYFNKYFNKPNNDMDYLNNEFDSNAIKAFRPSSDRPSFFTHN